MWRVVATVHRWMTTPAVNSRTRWSVRGNERGVEARGDLWCNDPAEGCPRRRVDDRLNHRGVIFGHQNVTAGSVAGSDAAGCTFFFISSRARRGVPVIKSARERAEAMAVAAGSFDTWLSSKLQALNTDESVFATYIKGILEGDESEDEKTEALESILAGVTEDDISKHVTEILSAWAEWFPAKDIAAAPLPTEDVDVRLARMLESQSLPTMIQRSYTEEERRIREAILAQYSQMSDEENSEGDGEEDGASGGDCGIEKNLNAATIVQQEREKREKAKLESQKKKEKDKEDREKQKQLKEEKKEKRKTQKGERRR